MTGVRELSLTWLRCAGMTHTDVTAHAERGTGSAALPAIGAIIMALLWGGYTIAVFYEIVFAS